jgi:hypothetical protein
MPSAHVLSMSGWTTFAGDSAGTSGDPLAWAVVLMGSVRRLSGSGERFPLGGHFGGFVRAVDTILLSASVLPRLPEAVGAIRSMAGSTKSAIDGETIGRYRASGRVHSTAP